MSTTLQFVLPATVEVAQLHFHYVEYSAMCNCASQEVQTGLGHNLVSSSQPQAKKLYLDLMGRVLRS